MYDKHINILVLNKKEDKSLFHFSVHTVFSASNQYKLPDSDLENPKPTKIGNLFLLNIVVEVRENGKFLLSTKGGRFEFGNWNLPLKLLVWIVRLLGVANADMEGSVGFISSFSETLSI